MNVVFFIYNILYYTLGFEEICGYRVCILDIFVNNKIGTLAHLHKLHLLGTGKEMATGQQTGNGTHLPVCSQFYILVRIRKTSYMKIK